MENRPGIVSWHVACTSYDKVCNFFALSDSLMVLEVKPMQIYVALGPVVALIAGILILMIPRLLNYIVAIYLIVTGILGLMKM